MHYSTPYINYTLLLYDNINPTWPSESAFIYDLCHDLFTTNITPSLNLGNVRMKTIYLIDLSTDRPPVLFFMIYASLASILIIIWKPHRSIIISDQLSD